MGFIESRMKAVNAMADKKRQALMMVPDSQEGAATGAFEPSGDLLEGLAALEHRKWCRWAQSMIEREHISEETRNRWNSFFVDYKDLPEDIKEYSRNNARNVMMHIGNYFLGKKST